MRKITSIIWKNLLLIFRSRTSALIIIFGPLLIMLIVGLALNNSGTVRINVGYYSPEYNNLTDSFISVLKASNYTLTKYDTEEGCRQDIMSGTEHICVIFPKNLMISNTNVSEIAFLVDNSKINFYQTVIDSIERDFNKRALQLTQGMTAELLEKLNQTQGSITNQSNTITSLVGGNTELKKEVSKISGEVKGLDLNFDYGSLGVDKLDRSVSDLSSSMDDLRSIADDAITQSKDLISGLEEDIKDMNMSSSDESDLLDKLNETGDKLNDLRDQLNESNDINTSEIESSISNLKKTLREFDTRFSEASKQRDAAVNEMKTLNTGLDQSMAKISAIEDTFNSIYANIASTQITSLQSITNPIQKEVMPVVIDQSDSQLNFYFPYLIVLLIMFIGLMLSSTLVIMEKTSRAHFRNFVTPTSDMTFVFGTYLTTMIILVVQLIIVLSLFALYFQKDIVTNMKSTLFILFLLTSLFALIGMAVGNLFNTEETGTLASISLGSVLLFVSDLVFPIEKMPPYVANIARTYNPFVVGTEILRKAIVHRIPVGSMGNDLYLILLYIISIFLLVMLTHKLMKRTYLLQWGGYIARREIRAQKQILLESELVTRYQNIDEKDYFETRDRQKIPDLARLAEFVGSLNEEAFKEYVNGQKNEFAEWVQNVLANNELASKVRRSKTMKGMAKVLSSAAKSYDKLSQKHSDSKKGD